MSQFSAILFTAVIGALCLFQLALALGAPWGRFAWGGQHEGRLPAGYRVGSVAGILVYAVFAGLALDRAGVIRVVPDAVSQIGMWVVFGVLVLGTLMNLISRSKPERYVMTPVALVLAILAGIIAVQGPANQSADRPVGTFTVIDSGSGAVLCEGGVMESHPPQCRGRKISGWSWDAVDRFEEASGVRWGEYELAVTPDGDRVTVVLADPVDQNGSDADDPYAGFGEPAVTWIEVGRTFDLVTYGSSSCPYIVAGVEATSVDQVVLRLTRSGGDVCTADIGPSKQQVVLPGEVSERPVTVLLDYTESDTLAKLTLP